MSSQQKTVITIEAIVNAPVEKVWNCWNTPEDIMKWNAASDDWHTTSSTIDLQAGGKYSSRMEAKDGSFGFDFWGIYDEVILHQKVASTMGDGRKLIVNFIAQGNSTKVIEEFEAENENPVELQRDGWLSILNNFKKYTESK